MKKLTVLFMALLVSMAFCACAGKPNEAEPTAEPTEKPPISMFDLSEALRSARGEGAELSYASTSDINAAEELAYVTDIDYEKVESFMMLYASDGSESTDEIVVIALKDASDANAAADSLNEHVESRIKLYNTYAPDKVDSLKNAEVFTKGRYAVLIICENADAVSRAFTEFIK